MELINYIALRIGYIVMLAMAISLVLTVIVGIQDVIENIQYRIILKKRRREDESED